MTELAITRMRDFAAGIDRLLTERESLWRILDLPLSVDELPSYREEVRRRLCQLEKRLQDARFNSDDYE